ncbi:uncharacterized protein LACBIDRAFT_324527 [Laccaria bicolor S238N-H82]|uniref:Predicted protein n=1 Tax=Laccaria bicolor (strain S238N-H82 / ATCC MYA-4686) TaxID=486041 RepID=B0D268_LACBS|nr:uncharacterized protein LACBIDRAFT_324527 [Laccaria bicolor S238N-H82]EDR11052.1 predicted protein [Laccaria bicolor S238N-H82]|eukprot:XP_001878353.1 predicted protein [Laccaria bicolor S238N-H82]
MDYNLCQHEKNVKSRRQRCFHSKVNVPAKNSTYKHQRKLHVTETRKPTCFSMTYSTATFPLDLYAVVRSSYPRSTARQSRGKPDEAGITPFKTVRKLCGVVGMFMLVWFAVTRLFPAYKPDHIRVTRHLCFHLPFQVVRMKANFRHVILLATSEKQTPQLGMDDRPIPVLESARHYSPVAFDEVVNILVTRKAIPIYPLRLTPVPFLRLQRNGAALHPFPPAFQ